MAFWINVLRILRHRTVALTALGLSLVLGVGAFLAIPTTYTSQATLVLTTSATNQAPSGDPSATPQVNPMLNFNEGLNTALAILVEAMNTATALNNITAGDRSSSIKITDIGDVSYLGNKGPFLFLTGTSTSSAQAAKDVVNRAAQSSRDELFARQRALNAPAAQFVTSVFVVSPTDAVASSSTRLEGGALGLLLGLVATVTTAYALAARRSSAIAGVVVDPDKVVPEDPTPTNGHLPGPFHNGRAPQSALLNGSAPSSSHQDKAASRAPQPTVVENTVPTDLRASVTPSEPAADSTDVRRDPDGETTVLHLPGLARPVVRSDAESLPRNLPTPTTESAVPASNQSDRTVERPHRPRPRPRPRPQALSQTTAPANSGENS